MSEAAVAVPAPGFAIHGVAAEPFAATPLLCFEARVDDPSGREVYTIALSAQVRIDADRRGYEPEARGRLLDLFGEAERIPVTAGALQVARVDVLVPSFTGSGAFELPVPFTADLEQATARYLGSLADGVVPLTFNLAGTIFYRGERDRLQVTPVPWSCDARYRLPVAVWRGLLEKRHAGSGFVRLQADTLDRLREARAGRGLPTFDATIAALLDG